MGSSDPSVVDGDDSRPSAPPRTSVPLRNPVLIWRADGHTGAMAGQPLVGRHDELAVLLSALESARAGAGRLVVVTGAPGIGKTRLAEAAIDAAHEVGLRVARGYAVADAGAP